MATQFSDPILENKNLKRVGQVSEKKEINEAERSIVAYGNTKAVDSYNESLLPTGWVFDRFAKNPVMPWSHDYSVPPVGKGLWWKTDRTGLLFKGQFAGTAFASEIWSLYKDDFLKAFSVGYNPMKEVRPDEDPEMYEQLLREWEITGRPRVIGTKQSLWEISPVVLPADADALVCGLKEHRVKTPEMLGQLKKLAYDETWFGNMGSEREELLGLVDRELAGQPDGFVPTILATIPYAELAERIDDLLHEQDALKAQIEELQAGGETLRDCWIAHDEMILSIAKTLKKILPPKQQPGISVQQAQQWLIANLPGMVDREIRKLSGKLE